MLRSPILNQVHPAGNRKSGKTEISSENEASMKRALVCAREEPYAGRALLAVATDGRTRLAC